jgi:signal transduction histidine kinase
VAASAERHGVLLEVTVDGAPVVQADAGQLVQAVVNLAVNAIHAMPAGGVLRLMAYAEAGNAVVVVEDSGIGMPPEVLRQIFHPFFTTKGPDGGTGLGLAVVHGIVSAHGGALDVQSTPNEGSRFEIVLPLWEDSASEESA